MPLYPYANFYIIFVVNSQMVIYHHLKIQTVAQHNEADISTWLPLEYDLQLTYGIEECSFNEYINSLRDEVRAVSEKKIKDNSKTAGRVIPTAVLSVIMKFIFPCFRRLRADICILRR